jgi:hypothetical protein
MPNMYGDLVAELGAGLIGGTGVAPGAHFGGTDGRELAVFEATHGTAAHLAGTNRADPIGLILSAAMLLRHIGEPDAGTGGGGGRVGARRRHIGDLRPAGPDGSGPQPARSASRTPSSTLLSRRARGSVA